MRWCEANGVEYVLGLAGNSRLLEEIAPELRQAKRRAKWTGRPARVFKKFRYRTRDSWSAERRVIGKAEWPQGEGNPRFIVTNIYAANGGARLLYEHLYRQRGEMENRIKECQTDLFADRTPTPTMRANQLRLWLSSLAYVCAALCRASHRPCRHAAGERHLRHNPAAAVEDRRARQVSVRRPTSSPAPSGDNASAPDAPNEPTDQQQRMPKPPDRRQRCRLSPTKQSTQTTDYALRLDREKRGYEFYKLVLDTTTDPEIRALAKKFVAEEAEHVEWLEHWIAADQNSGKVREQS